MGNKKKRKYTKPMRWTDNPKIAKRGDHGGHQRTISSNAPFNDYLTAEWISEMNKLNRSDEASDPTLPLTFLSERSEERKDKGEG